MKNVNPHKFIRKNYKWLIKWIENAEPYPDCYFNGRAMQIFKDCLGVTTIGKIKESETRNMFSKKEIKAIKDQHIYNILNSCIFSIGSTTMSGQGQEVSTMNGFVNLYKRLPTKKDKVQIYYLAGNGLKRWQQEHYIPNIKTTAVHVCYTDKREKISTVYNNLFMMLSECIIVGVKNGND